MTSSSVSVSSGAGAQRGAGASRSARAQGPAGPWAAAALSRRGLFTALGAAGAAVMGAGALAACAPQTATSAGVRRIRVGWKSDLDTLNPVTTVTTEAVEVLSLVYDTLLTYGLDLKPQPGLALSSTSSGKTITYKLRENVSWHDGQPFTADDVVYTFKLIADHELGVNMQFLADLTHIVAKDATTVVATFRHEQAFDPGLIVPIMPKHVWSTKTVKEIEKDTNPAPIGTGPFTFTSWKQGQSAVVTRFDTWWGSAPAASGVTWTLYTNDDLLAQALRSGDVDFIPQVPPTVFQGLTNVKGVTTKALGSFSFHHIGINVDAKASSKGNPLLRDKAVRQALSCALDREQITQIAYAGYAEPGGALLSPAFGAYHYEPAAADVLDKNPAKAIKLLEAAGYTRKNGDGIRLSPGGKPLSFRIIAIDSTTVDVRTAQLFEAQALKVGIKLEFSTVDSDTMASTVYNTDGPDWDLFVWGWDTGVVDPDYLLGVPLTSQIGSNNDVFYSDTTFDLLFAEQAAELDEARRVVLVQQIQKHFYEDCAYLVVAYPQKLQAYTPGTWDHWTDVPGGIIFNFTRDNYLTAKPVGGQAS